MSCQIRKRFSPVLKRHGRKQLTELFGDYWHTLKARAIAEERTAHFERFGYETLILWEHDLHDEGAVLMKIRDFAKGR